MDEQCSAYETGPFVLRKSELLLTNRGTRIPLRRQAARLLLFLIDRRGGPVPRAEIEHYLWDGSPHPNVSADQRINACIRLIRLALNDHAKAPTYIATTENGYEFIAPVVAIRDPDPGNAAADARPVLDPQWIDNHDELRKAAGHNLRVIYGLVTMISGAAVGFGIAATIGSYGLAILACCIACLFAIILYRRVEDTLYARAAVGSVVLATMAYIPSAATLSQVVSSVINATTLRPAVVYPFITGMKFVPLFFAVLLEWFCLRLT